jgi:signal transduction histidine kinase
MAPGSLPRCDPFFTTKDHGLGIGLYLCHKIASLHRGRIEAGDSVGGGAEFRVYFPINPPDEGVPPFPDVGS